MRTQSANGLYVCLRCKHTSEVEGEVWWQPSTPGEPGYGDFAPSDEPTPCPEHGSEEMYLDEVREVRN